MEIYISPLDLWCRNIVEEFPSSKRRPVNNDLELGGALVPSAARLGIK